jgi:hypothetical protein
MSFWLIGLLFFSSFRGQAQSAEDYSKTIGKHSKTTYLDLLRLVFPDLKKDGIAHQSVEIRNEFETTETQSYEGRMEVKFGAIDRSNGRVILEINLISNEIEINPRGIDLIALYRIGKKTELLDVVDQTQPEETFYQGKLKIHPKMEAIFYQSEHHTAGENFRHFSFFYIAKNRFQILPVKFPSLYFSNRCQSEILENGTLSTAFNPKNAYRDIIFKIKVTGKKFRQDCKTLTGKTVKTFRLRSSWQNGKYKDADGGTQLKRMRSEEKRLGFRHLE